MKLTELLEKITYEVKQGEDAIDIKSLAYDSRKVGEGTVFVCISGAVRDAHEFIPEVQPRERVR